MIARVSAILAILFVAANAGFFDDISGATSDVGKFFGEKFQNAKDLFSNNQSELENNVQRVKDLLIGLKEKVHALEPLASDAQKETLKKVDSFLSQVTDFQKEVKEEGSAKFEENKGKWEEKVTEIFDKGGLSSVLKLVGLQNASPIAQFISVVAAPIFYMIFVR
ncbi:unnamed protein product [Caenorhabditis sp. 36 PRJEB53466]|nr:unnamed protein product [Caenorhabditis sp. 36 PRJEB53466]